MNTLNDDMQHTLDNLDATDDEKKLLHDILYAERVNKDKEWSQDARKAIKKSIDERG